MNEYRYEDLSIGLTESFSHVVTKEDMENFLRISGDVNPLHNDADFAKEKGFKDRVVYGMLTASLISTMGGVYLPGKYCLIQQVESKFVSPVFIGDELTVTGKVSELNDSVKQAVIKIEIRNQEDKKVVRAILKVGFLDE